MCESVTVHWCTHLISMVFPSVEHEAAITLRRTRSVALAVSVFSAPTAGMHRG